MSAAAKPLSETPEILGPGENRIRVPAEMKKKKNDLQEKKKLVNNANSNVVKKLVSQSPKVAFRKDGSTNTSSDSSSSSSSSIDGSGRKSLSFKKEMRNNATNVKNSAKVVPDEVKILKLSPIVQGPVKRCDWITPNSDPIYTKFHDEEWGVPVYDERKLFELLVLSQALSELTWPTILNNRNTFRIMFDDFDPKSIASFDEMKLQSMETKGNLLLSVPKVLAIVQNAKQVLKIRQEFGCFSNYCWNFVKQKPIRNGFKYARQVPAKTPKSELISKDLMRRGFQRVGPTVVYSFMQVSGMANDHLLSCFRYTNCNNIIPDNTQNRDLSPKAFEEIHTCLVHNDVIG